MWAEPRGCDPSLLVVIQVLAPKLFLNTFGGNPVCCAGGRAVLRVIDNEGIQANCAKVPYITMSS